VSAKVSDQRGCGNSRAKRPFDFVRRRHTDFPVVPPVEYLIAEMGWATPGRAGPFPLRPGPADHVMRKGGQDRFAGTACGQPAVGARLGRHGSCPLFAKVHLYRARL